MKPVLKWYISLLFTGSLFPVYAQFNADSIQTFLLITVDAKNYETSNHTAEFDEYDEWKKISPSKEHRWLRISEAFVHVDRERFSYASGGWGSQNHFFYYDTVTTQLRIMFANPATHYQMAKFPVPLSKPGQRFIVKQIYTIDMCSSTHDLTNEYVVIHYIYGYRGSIEVYGTILLSCHAAWIRTGGYRCNSIFKYDFPLRTSLHPFLFMDVNMDGYIDLIEVDRNEPIPKIQVFYGDAKGRFAPGSSCRIAAAPSYPFYIIYGNKNVIFCKVVIV